jgi:hypothetical protein
MPFDHLVAPLSTSWNPMPDTATGRNTRLHTNRSTSSPRRLVVGRCRGSLAAVRQGDRHLRGHRHRRRHRQQHLRQTSDFYADALEPFGSFVRDDLVGVITHSQSLHSCH